MIVAGVAFDNHVAASNHINAMMHSRVFFTFPWHICTMQTPHAECLEWGHNTQKETH